MIRVVSFICIFCGGVLMVFSSIKFMRLLRVGVSMPAYARIFRISSIFLLGLFQAGYVVGAVDVLVGVANPMYYFIGIIFFFAGVFLALIMQYITLLTRSLQEKNEQIEQHNHSLETQIQTRVQEVLRQDQLLHTVNEVSSILLGTEVEEFEQALWKCMGMMAESVQVDRMYIWENHIRDGRLLCSQIYEWSEGADPQQGNELTVDIPYEDVAPGWEEKLSKGKSVKGMVKNLSSSEEKHLSAQGILSILVVPVFLQGSFWGFVGFDDCHRERDFSDAEENILRSGSNLFAAAVLRNDMMEKLMEAREEALISTKAKSSFLSNMSHEIRTPINAISGMAAIARKSHDLSKVHDCLNKIDAATNQLLAIVNDILDMSKIEAGKMELNYVPFNLHSMLANVRSIVGVRSKEKNQKMGLTIADDVPKVVIGDDIRLSQIVINLLSNAVKFTPEGGKINIKARLDSQEGNRCQVTIDVEDNGIGISQEQQGRLFTAFEQAEKSTARVYGGTGLGLAISKRIARLMGGDISVKSELGKGSRFTVRVWVEAALESQLNDRLAEQSEEGDGDMANLQVMLVEDIAINREIICELLGEKDILITCVENGREAVDLFAADPEKYDIIFMDVHMPVMDGYAATREIRSMKVQRAQTVPIIAMTANAFQEDVELCLQSGMNDHIAKPIDIARLYHLVKKYRKRQ